MRYLLIIPALFLFLSNIPFIQEMNMEEMEEISAGPGCCKKNGNMEGMCHKPEVQKEESGENHCPNPKTGNNCVCICCFQYVAPEQVLVRFNMNENVLRSNYSLLQDQHWLDPFLAGPWQPPDLN